ncbi:hypothetical protein D3C76_1285830 [compost metagenome]
MGARFQEVKQIVRLLELARSIGKVDAAVSGDIQVVGEAEGQAFGFGREYGDLSLRVDAQQALVGIAHDQVAGGVEVHAQRPAAGVGEGFQLAIGIDAHDPPVMQAGKEATLGVDGGVLGAMHLAGGDQLGLHQGVVGLQHAGHGRGLGRVPGQRVDGGRGDGEVDRQRDEHQSEYAQQFLHLLLVSLQVRFRPGPYLSARDF